MKNIAIALKVPVIFFGVVNLLSVVWYLEVNNQLLLALSFIIGTLEVVCCLLPEKTYSTETKVIMTLSSIFVVAIVANIISSLVISGWLGLGAVIGNVIELIAFVVFIVFQILVAQPARDDSSYEFSS